MPFLPGELISNRSGSFCVMCGRVFLIISETLRLRAPLQARMTVSTHFLN